MQSEARASVGARARRPAEEMIADKLAARELRARLVQQSVAGIMTEDAAYLR